MGVLPRLNNKQAIRIFGKLKQEYKTNTLVDCEGDEVWFPNRYIQLLENGELLVEKWLYDLKVRTGEL